MPLVFDENGLQIQTFPEALQELVTALQGIYGADINLTSSTPDGQRVGIEAKMSHDFQQALLALWNSFDPDLAQGEQLAKIAKLTGIFPRAAVKSTWQLTVTTDRTVTLPVGYQVRDTLDQTWSTTAEYAGLESGDVIVVTADRWGVVQPFQDEETVTPVTVIKGVTAVAGVDSSVVPGVAAETDAEFRARRQASLQNPAYSTVGALVAKLGGLGGVTQVRVYENSTDEDLVLDDTTLPPHSIWVVVLGGTAADIAETIIKQKTMGCYLYGSLEETVTEEVDLPDGSTLDIVHTARYDEPATHTLDIEVTASDEDGNPLDGPAAVLLDAAFRTFSFAIGEPVSAGEFYQLGYAALPGQVVIWDLELTDGGGPCTGLCYPGAGALFEVGTVTINAPPAP